MVRHVWIDYNEEVMAFRVLKGLTGNPSMRDVRVAYSCEGYYAGSNVVYAWRTARIRSGL